VAPPLCQYHPWIVTGLFVNLCINFNEIILSLFNLIAVTVSEASDNQVLLLTISLSVSVSRSQHKIQSRPVCCILTRPRPTTVTWDPSIIAVLRFDILWIDFLIDSTAPVICVIVYKITRHKNRSHKPKKTRKYVEKYAFYLSPWWWRQYAPLKRRFTSTRCYRHISESCRFYTRRRENLKSRMSNCYQGYK
jgi:hypothetical protein